MYRGRVDLVDDPGQQPRRNRAAQETGLRRRTHDVEAGNRRFLARAEFLSERVAETLQRRFPHQIAGADSLRRARWGASVRNGLGRRRTALRAALDTFGLTSGLGRRRRRRRGGRLQRLQLRVVVGAQRFIAERLVGLCQFRRLDGGDLLELLAQVLDLVGMVLGDLAAERALDFIGGRRGHDVQNLVVAAPRTHKLTS